MLRNAAGRCRAPVASEERRGNRGTPVAAEERRCPLQPSASGCQPQRRPAKDRCAGAAARMWKGPRAKRLHSTYSQRNAFSATCLAWNGPSRCSLKLKYRSHIWHSTQNLARHSRGFRDSGCSGMVMTQAWQWFGCKRQLQTLTNIRTYCDCILFVEMRAHACRLASAITLASRSIVECSQSLIDC